MSEAEVARDLHAVLAKVRQGVEIVIEQDHRPVAVLKSSPPVACLISGIGDQTGRRGGELGYSVSMRALGFVTLLASSLTLSADTRTVTKMTFLGPNSRGLETISTEYEQDDNSRTESEVRNGDSPARQLISITLGGKVGYQLDPKAREYVEYQIPQTPPLRPGAQEPGGSITTYQSGKTLDIYVEITDTGERKEFFGQTAEHLIWRERRVAEPGACGMSSTREIDGWYFPEPVKMRPQGILTISYGVLGGKTCVDKIVVHGRSPGGLAVITKNDAFKMEIIELSHEPLDKSLFEVPSGYTKVQNLPMLQSPPPPPPTWSQILEWEWAQLLRELESWLR